MNPFPNRNAQHNQGPASKFSGLVGNAIKKIDRFGYPISMTYNNEQTFKSVFGGSMTILSIFCLIIYLGIQLNTAITLSKYTST